MSARLITLVAILLGIANVHAQSVGSESRKGTDTKQDQTLENSQNIQIRKGQTKRGTQGSDRRKADERSKEKRQTDDISAELQASALFTPMIQQIETGEIDTGDNEVAQIFRQCRFFTAAPAVPIALGARPEPEEISYLQGRMALSYRPGADMPKIRVRGDILWRHYDWYDGKYVYRFESPRNLARCNFAYGLTIAAAMRSLARDNSIKETPLQEKVVLVRGDLQERASNALVSAMRSPSLMKEITANAIRVTSNDCILPTITGVNQGNVEWQCGSLKVDPARVQATMAGLTVLGENQFMGQRLNFAQVSGQSDTARSSDSRSVYSSQDQTQESGRDVSMSRRKSTNTNQSSKQSASGKADTSANPTK